MACTDPLCPNTDIEPPARRARFVLPGGESATAALRRAEHERDGAQAALNALSGQHHLVLAELAGARAELDAVRTARDNLGRELAELRRDNVRLRGAP